MVSKDSHFWPRLEAVSEHYSIHRGRVRKNILTYCFLWCLKTLVIGVRTSLRGKSFLILADLKSFRKMKKGRGALSLLYSSYHDYILFQAKWNNVGDVPSILFGARFLYFPNESKICMREKLVDHHNLHGKKEIRDFSKIFFFFFSFSSYFLLP